ncbi:venom acid phosphatase Acph-1-like [Anthonomus grandis grandis]|uniref:venom acid phosphatase Acph-1-like n=1 Tax=Anthonomus grandis grandis TaxID=2921223 RepID=UPI002165DD8C|nr:venom acid phosphatase Acph-1-like [Anthonomus grandis grandis]
MNSIVTICLALSAFCYLEIVSGRPSVNNDTLLLVHTLFRHGNRTPDSNGYDNNPINESYYAEGYSQLTNEGKRTEYKLGTTLRQRYSSFLGNTWKANYLAARSTNVTRTKMSLQLVLAALYPPRGNQIWNRHLNWQPIPYDLVKNDAELSGSRVCSNYSTEVKKVLYSDEIQEALSVYDDIFKYLSNQTGQNISTPNDIFDLYFNLITQEEYGYPLEEWWEPVWPEALARIVIENYYIKANTTYLKQITAGLLLKKMITDSKAKIDGTISPTEIKMYLYSAHEMNIASFLIALGVFDDSIPNYGSHILLELHLIDGVYGFKVFYENWTASSPRLLTIPGCNAFCPYDDFVSLLEEIIPNEGIC